jgi:hypothetical protein
MKKNAKSPKTSGSPDPERIQNMFDEAVGELLKPHAVARFDWNYVRGVRDALGWVLGQYTDAPEL